jgi:hypothetical protein
LRERAHEAADFVSHAEIAMGETPEKPQSETESGAVSPLGPADPTGVAPEKKERKRRSPKMLNALSALVGLVTLAAGVGWVAYKTLVDLEPPYFAIPLVMTVPVIAAVVFRSLWED